MQLRSPFVFSTIWADWKRIVFGQPGRAAARVPAGTLRAALQQELVLGLKSSFDVVDSQVSF